MAAKKKSSSSRSSAPRYSKAESTKKTLYIVILLLALVAVFVAFKHAKLKRDWMQYAGQSQKTILESNAKNTEDEAQVIGRALTAQVSGKPLYKSTDLQAYVTNVSKQLNRDVVVLDTNKKILADTVSGNVGKTFMEDKDGQVANTIKDGMTRNFTETSSDYPHGLEQVVVALKDNGGKVVGAVVLSSDTLQK